MTVIMITVAVIAMGGVLRLAVRGGDGGATLGGCGGGEGDDQGGSRVHSHHYDWDDNFDKHWSVDGNP